MWPFERKVDSDMERDAEPGVQRRVQRGAARECLRVGRVALERWVEQGARLRKVAASPLPPDAVSRPECLAQALVALHAGPHPDRQGDPPAGPVTLVLESAWLAVLLADTGGALLKEAEAEALVRHRLGACHAGPGDDMAAWDVRVDCRAGERFVLGYGLAPRVKHALLGAAERAGLRLEGLVPALLWGWRRHPVKAGWWLLAEQDRSLLARVDAGRLVALNAAVAPHGAGAVAGTGMGTGVERAVQIESARWGLPQHGGGAVTAVSWSGPEHLPPKGERVDWVSIVGKAPAP